MLVQPWLTFRLVSSICTYRSLFGQWLWGGWCRPTIYFLLFLCPPLDSILISRSESQYRGPGPILNAQISFEGPNSALKAQIQPWMPKSTCHTNLSLKTQIPKAGRRKRKLPKWVKDQVIKPFRATALLPPSSSQPSSAGHKYRWPLNTFATI